MRALRFLMVASAFGAAVACSQKSPDGARSAAIPPAESPAAQADASRPNAVLDAAQWDDPQVKAAYAAAKKYAAVLEQLYCYCRCKENLGHRALVECFETNHASMCDVCMTEAMTAARMTEQGKTPKEIQQAIDAYYRT
ncbi:MAG: CYCXC family (seleno)protein [Gemmatimonadaceae bacterium]